MKTDRYTKTVLTIIAICLVWISLGGPSFVAPAKAQTQPEAAEPQRVYVAGYVDPNGKVRTLDATPGVSGLPVWVNNR